MYILKFGGRSLADQKRVNAAIDIIIDSYKQRPTVVVVSALGDTTQQLNDIIKVAISGADSVAAIQSLCTYFRQNFDHFELEEECKQLVKLIAGISLLKDASDAIRDEVLALGETISAKFLNLQLRQRDLTSVFIDARQLFITNNVHQEAEIDSLSSKKRILDHFAAIDNSDIPVLGGFIGTSKSGKTTTFGRNGSDYSAAFLASALGAEKLEIWKHIDGFCTIDPAILKSGQLIPQLSYKETDHLLKSGSNLLHPKTIEVIRDAVIPIEIRNSFKPSQKGTVINYENGEPEYLTVQQDQISVSVQSLNQTDIVQIYSQLISTIPDIQLIDQQDFCFVTQRKNNERVIELINQFQTEKKQKYKVICEAGLVSISWQIGPKRSIDQIKHSLRIAEIEFRIAHSILSQQRHSLIIKHRDLKRCVELIHRDWFEVNNCLNIAVFGVGQVGKVVLELIEQSNSQTTDLANHDLRIFATATSKGMRLSDLDQQFKKPDVKRLIYYAKSRQLKNLVFIDTTNSAEIIKSYPSLIKAGFDIVAANKFMNSSHFSDYASLRQLVKEHQREFFYETNVGAALPIIQTLRELQKSGDTVQQIRGVFSGSLSYLFNEYSRNGNRFSNVLKKAVDHQLTESDPKQDLLGQDVARKLVILAREIGFKLNTDDIEVQSLVPPELESQADIGKNETVLDLHFKSYKQQLKKGQVLRYVADLKIDKATVSLATVDASSNLGQLEHADNLFEIFTTRYADQPLVIKGAGAGAEITASGVLTDILKIAHHRLSNTEWSLK